MRHHTLTLIAALTIGAATAAVADDKSNQILGGDVVMTICTTCTPATVNYLDEQPRRQSATIASANDATFYYYGSTPTAAKIETKRATNRLPSPSVTHTKAVAATTPR